MGGVKWARNGRLTMGAHSHPARGIPIPTTARVRRLHVGVLPSSTGLARPWGVTVGALCTARAVHGVNGERYLLLGLSNCLYHECGTSSTESVQVTVVGEVVRPKPKRKVCTVSVHGEV